MLTDALEIHFISMSRFRQLSDVDIAGNPLHRWLAFFNKNTNVQTLKKIIMMDTGIAKAQEKILFVSRDRDALRAYRIREKAMSDYTSGINDARREGIAIGEQRGKQKGIAIGEQKTLARYVSKLSQKGMALKEIAELTDLSPEEVDDLLK
jgi:predicted transposase/invertase (TIGR01784 family)